MKTLLKELLIVLALVALGVFGLPALIFLVGQTIIGEYEAGMPAFYDAIGNKLVTGNGYAWLLVLSPYLGLQLLRFSWWLRRTRRPVN